MANALTRRLEPCCKTAPPFTSGNSTRIRTRLGTSGSCSGSTTLLRRCLLASTPPPILSSTRTTTSVRQSAQAVCARFYSQSNARPTTVSRSSSTIAPKSIKPKLWIGSVRYSSISSSTTTCALIGALRLTLATKRLGVSCFLLRLPRVHTQILVPDLVFEYVDGMNLRTYMSQHKDTLPGKNFIAR